MSKCKIDGCENGRYAYSLCVMHYFRLRRHGDPMVVFKVKGIKNSGNLIYVAIAEKALGKNLPHGAQVHHVDRDRNNNKNSNLVICPNQSYHALLHVRMRALEECGEPNYRKCNLCKKWDDPVNMRPASKKHNSFLHLQCKRNKYHGIPV